MNNRAIAGIFREIAIYLDMDGVSFKPRAYERAADAIEALDRPLGEIHAEGGLKGLKAIPGIGSAIAEKIVELVTTNGLEYHARLRREMPVDAAALVAIEGVGPKNIKALHRSLGIKTVDDLERAARAHQVRDLPHFGEKSEERILRSISFLRANAGRFP